MSDKTIYSTDNITDRTEQFATTTVAEVLKTLETAPENKYDIQMVFFTMLSQLTYAHKHIFNLPDYNLQEALYEGTKQNI